MIKRFIFILGVLGGIYSVAIAATNIDSTNRWAWNDTIGWVDLYTTNTVMVSGSKIQGYASSSIGSIAFDCATAPVPDCTTPYGVTHNGDGILRGFAWSENIGWISFNCADIGGGGCSPNYSVSIDSNGVFSGWAWNDTIGWISFNCVNTGNCGVSDYKVTTTANTSPLVGTLDSTTYDTGGDSAFYTLMYQGTRPAGTVVKFQFASSANSNGPWNFIGPDGQTTSYYVPTGPGISVDLTTAYHNNHRYFRYRVVLESDAWRTVSPQVDDVIVGWSQ